jgi:hypothetical protein
MLRLILTLALVGFAGIILIGPALGLLAAVLGLFVAIFAVLAPFVVVGFLFWLPFRLLFARKRHWPDARDIGATAMPSTAGSPARWCARGMHEAATWPGRLRHRLAVLGGVVLEMTCGALIGTGLGWALAYSLTRREAVLYTLLGGLFGAALGLLVGLTNHISALRNRPSSS